MAERTNSKNKDRAEDSRRGQGRQPQGRPAPVRDKQRYPNQSPWAIPVAQVGSHVGQSLEIDRDFPAPSGIGDEFYGLVEGSPVRVRARFDSIVDGLVFSGTASGRVTGECGRCLTPIDREVVIDLSTFMPYEKEEKVRSAKRIGRKPVDYEDVIIAGEEEDDEVTALSPDGDFADLETLLRDGFVQEIPVTPLCKPDCKGLCPQCGIDLNEQPDHVHQLGDIRLAGLAGLREQLVAQDQDDAQDDKIEGMH